VVFPNIKIGWEFNVKMPSWADADLAAGVTTMGFFIIEGLLVGRETFNIIKDANQLKLLEL